MIWVGLYLVVGVLLVGGFLRAVGGMNDDGDVVGVGLFVLVWPVAVFAAVVGGGVWALARVAVWIGGRG